MQQSAAVSQQHDAQRPRVVGRPWKPGQSGNPSGARVLNQRIADLFNTLAVDFGGEAALSAIDRALLMQSCVLLTRAQRTRDVDAAVRLTSESRRGLMALRRHRRSPDVATLSLREQLQIEADAAAGAAVDGPGDMPANTVTRIGDVPAVTVTPSGDEAASEEADAHD
jgi:hypothetical protein